MKNKPTFNDKIDNKINNIIYVKPSNSLKKKIFFI